MIEGDSLSLDENCECGVVIDGVRDVIGAPELVEARDEVTEALELAEDVVIVEALRPVEDGVTEVGVY